MLRRTPLNPGSKPLVRRTPLPRAGMVRAAKMKAHPRPKNTGPGPAERNLVLERAGGCCELCGVLLHDGQGWIRAHSIHHRRARGMGGTVRPDTNTAPNLLLVCGTGTTGCHGHIEANRADAVEVGWLVSQTTDPATVPAHVRYGPDLRAVYLTPDGDYSLTTHQTPEA